MNNRDIKQSSMNVLSKTQENVSSQIPNLFCHRMLIFHRSINLKTPDCDLPLSIHHHSDS